MKREGFGPFFCVHYHYHSLSVVRHPRTASFIRHPRTGALKFGALTY